MLKTRAYKAQHKVSRTIEIALPLHWMSICILDSGPLRSFDAIHTDSLYVGHNHIPAKGQVNWSFCPIHAAFYCQTYCKAVLT